VVPRKPPNPCIASMERRDLHRELAFHQKTWVVSVVIHACQTKQNIKKKRFQIELSDSDDEKSIIDL
jgi:hypothetical protein